MNRFMSAMDALLSFPGARPVLWMLGGGTIALIALQLLTASPDGGATPENCDANGKMDDRIAVRPASGTERRNAERTISGPSLRGPIHFPYFMLVPGLVIFGGIAGYEFVSWLVRKRTEYADERLESERKNLAGEWEKLRQWQAREESRLAAEEERFPLLLEQRVAEEIARQRDQSLLAIQQARKEAEEARETARKELDDVRKRARALAGIEEREAKVARRERRVACAEGSVARERQRVGDLVRANEVLVLRIDAGCEFLGAALIDYLVREPLALERLMSVPELPELLAAASGGG